MFSRIPQRLTAPFGLLGDEAKLAFRSQPGGIAKLATSRHISETDTYWDQYITLFDSASDVFSLITPHDIRRACSEAPENIATLCKVITARLFNLVSDHTFPTPSTSMTTFASSLIKAGSTERQTTKEALNCLRLLQRVLPVLFEVDSDSGTLENDIFWKVVEVEDTDSVPVEEPQFVIDDEDESENEGTPQQRPQPKPKKILPSLAERLINCLIDLLFCCGFTLPSKIQVDHYKINYVIWERGIGSATDPGPNQTSYDSNRTEVLRLLLVLLSRQMYAPPSSLLSSPSLYTLHFVQKTPRRHVLTILCSLLNTAMNSSQPMVTIGTMAGKLPYNHLVFKGEDPRLNLVSICFQVLNILLDFQSGTARDPSTTGVEDNQVTVPTVRSNAFRYFVAKLHRPQDFAFLLNGVMLILEQEVSSMNNLLPGARKSAPYLMDNVILLWKLIELNKKFRAHILESEKSMDLVAYLLCYCLEIKDKPQQHGLCRVLSYIVQTLSAEPAFGNKLSNPVKANIPSKWAFPGTAADFLVNAIYAIVATTAGTLSSIYPALIIALSNSAPYFKNLTVNSSARLIQLFNSISNPLFLLADEGHPRLLFFMLEVFNAVIFHHISENPNLVYNILTTHKTFENLGTFTLARGLRDIRRAQSRETITKESESQPSSEKAQLQERFEATDEALESAEGGISVEMNSPPLSPLPDGATSRQILSEKARGKMRARRSESLDNIDRTAAVAVGRNGFVPTQEWVTSWQQGLPLDPVMLVISELLPRVQDMQAASRHKPNSTATIVEFLENVTLKHVLPSIPPVSQRRFLWSDASLVWLTSLLWGEIFVKGMTPLGIWSATNVKLFYVKHAQGHPRQISETVSNVVGGLLGRSASSADISPSGRH